jgi:hypothetical protein
MAVPPHSSVLIDENKVCYDENILTTATDFNRTVEYFGDNNGFSYHSQRLWIVTKSQKHIYF